jgi:hypothetical protein
VKGLDHWYSGAMRGPVNARAEKWKCIVDVNDLRLKSRDCLPHLTMAAGRPNGLQPCT